MSECSSNCSSCSEKGCASHPQSLIEPCNKYSKVNKVIGVISGKGGVGKSLVTSYTSVLMNRLGYKTAILDADVTGPSIPKTFGIKSKAQGDDKGILPTITDKGIKMMSVNLLLDNEAIPVLWRGPVIAGTVKQFWSEVVWGDVDYMFVDMPPGTGDVPLTVFQSIPLDGIIIVTSPQELVSLIVEKAVNMAKAMNIPILGLVENYSYIECGSCGEKIAVFGESHVDEIAKKYNLKVLAKMPIETKIAKAVDTGKIEELEGNWLDGVASFIKENVRLSQIKDKQIEEDSVIRIAVPSDNAGNIDEHFGKATKFLLYEIKDNKLFNKTEMDASGAGHEKSAELLAHNKVNVLLCGGIGMGAMDALFTKKIKVIPGMQGDIEVAVSSYLDGTVKESNGPTCNCHEEHTNGCNCTGGCH